MIWALAAACALASVPAGLRWLRIAQREHYLAGSVGTFATRWWSKGPLNIALGTIMTLGVAAPLVWSPWWGFLVPLAQVGPVGLGVRGRTSPLAWTGRLRRLAALSGFLFAAVVGVGAVLESGVVVVLALFILPELIDLALLVLAPLEDHLGRKWVDQARSRLATSGARVVAITGSYGKTTTKQYAAHLLSGSFRVVASPASFNNRMGLARAINEQLVPGTEIFVAEMGTYGPGEIAELCSWIRPEVSAILAIGPVHLERFRTEERIVSAKSEILDGAKVGVLSVDHPLLHRLAAEREGSMEVITVSTRDRARVEMRDGQIYLDGHALAAVPDGALEINLGVAFGICLAIGVDPDRIVSRLGGLPRPEHRQTVTRSERGFLVIDDTYNSNPAGAHLALSRLQALADGGRRVLVTPGMVELGPIQARENEVFAAAAAEIVDDIVVVARTNRSALLRGSANGRASVTVVASRDEAVTWVRDHLGPGDAVLYENDLPDHYP